MDGENLRLAVLVNGLPGAGKSTLAAGLSQHLGLPLLSKDVIKEIHADVLGSSPNSGHQRAWNAALGTAASRTMWALLATAPAGAVVESSWRADVRDLAADGLRQSPHLTAVEIWCDVPADVARKRMENRHPRHPIHGELPSDAEWENWATLGRPLALGPVLRVDTTRPVAWEPVLTWIRSHATPQLEGDPSPANERRDGNS
ncbi:AAA family ATPase [Streptacidiphilus sp. MAP5-52]|uniref:AAA family ATPase n=1 Tax=Streptacidiphilus sp. MAP5-52 TaxID=3156267 RepID=UPI003513FD93